MSPQQRQLACLTDAFTQQLRQRGQVAAVCLPVKHTGCTLQQTKTKDLPEEAQAKG